MFNTLTIIVTVILAILTFLVPRKYFLAPYIIAACFVPTDQRILIAGLDFTALRILIVVGTVRLWLLGEIRTIRLNRFDKILLLWVFCGAIIYVAQWQDMRALIYTCGVLFDIIGLYLLFRQSIRSWSDIILVFKLFAVCAIVIAPLVALERTSGKNPFLVFGKVWTSVREGRYRCQAAFPHSIMFGLFWANLTPIFIGLAIAARRKALYCLAAATGVFMVMASASSTPIGTLGATLFLVGLFHFRCYGRLIALGLCAMTVALHMVMQAPVWHLISRVSIMPGSTGWHRYNLINQTINHFPEWALFGTRSTAHWGYFSFDITNQYCLEAVRGGLITLSLFVVLLVFAIRTVGSYSLMPMRKNQQWLSWCICVSILGHCISFIGVSYFGQIHLLLYLTFAIVGFICEISSSPSYVGGDVVLELYTSQ